jgi:uncharacterized protein
VGKKVKVIFDTNVWISIFMQKTLNDEFYKTKEKINIYISRDIILEVSKVLLYPKVKDVINETNWKRKEILRAIEANSIVVQPKAKLFIIEKDPEDNKILECALAAESDIIVSGDKHLIELGKFKKTRILSPREFFDSLKR